jgi:hypothetical protein
VPTACESGARGAIVKAEALAEFFPIVAAPQHLDQVTGEEKEEGDGEEKVIEKADHGR